jgi:succinoglycan biosynthesis protein ExoH
MDKEISQLIRSLRLIMVIGLVFVHFGKFPGDALDPFTGVVEAKFVIASSLNSFFTYFFLCSVPILSMISGYLYLYQGTPNYFEVVRKKSKTLLLPYLIWTTFWLLVAFLLYTIGKSTNQFTYYDQGFANYDVLNLLNGIVGLTKTPFAFQFWFIHDLILSIALTPLLIPAIKKLGLVIVFTPFLLWITGFEAWVFFNFKVISFFILGLYIASKKIELTIPKKLIWLNISIIIFIIMVLIRIYLPSYNNGKMPVDTAFELFLRIIGSFAIIAITLNMRLYLKSVYKYLSEHSGYAFFLHAFHFPLIIIIKQILFMSGIFLGELGLILLWLISILMTVLITMCSAETINRYVPSVYKFLNGQRSI